MTGNGASRRQPQLWNCAIEAAEHGVWIKSLGGKRKKGGGEWGVGEEWEWGGDGGSSKLAPSVHSSPPPINVYSSHSPPPLLHQLPRSRIVDD
ncbi:MAG: hypothetical protein ACKERG_03455 [Candidatus Hodgkinia cicadicola]